MIQTGMIQTFGVMFLLLIIVCLLAGIGWFVNDIRDVLKEILRKWKN